MTTGGATTADTTARSQADARRHNIENIVPLLPMQKALLLHSDSGDGDDPGPTHEGVEGSDRSSTIPELLPAASVLSRSAVTAVSRATAAIAVQTSVSDSEVDHPLRSPRLTTAPPRPVPILIPRASAIPSAVDVRPSSPRRVCAIALTVQVL